MNAREAVEVALLVSAWIETLEKLSKEKTISVALLVSAWIETSKRIE